MAKKITSKEFKKMVLGSYDASGRLCNNVLFTHIFGLVPDIYAFNLKEETRIDVNNITEEILYDIFPNLQDYWIKASGSAVTTSAVDDVEDEEESVTYIGGNYLESNICLMTDEYICCIYSGQVVFYYTDYTLKEVQEETKRVLEKVPFKEHKNQSAKISLICYDGRDYYTTESSIKATTVDFDLNYNDDFKEENKKIVEFLASRESGLVLLHGVAGTGKTTYIRHLVTNHPKEYILVPPGMMPHMGSPEFISFIMSHRNSVFILEDCEQLLIDRQISQFNNGISTVLNMSDGLLSDIFNLKFICTFNAEVSAIDSALTRPGRCYGDYEFKALNKEKVAKLAEINNIPLTEAKDMVLADLFNNNFEVKPDKNNKKIGF